MTWILADLLWQLLQCYFGSMNWLWFIWRMRHVVPKHSDLVLLGNMGYRLFTQLSCKQKSTVLSFCNQCWSGCFSCSSLEMFCARKVSDYLENTSYSSRGTKLFCTSGMKSLDVSRSLRRYQIPINSIKPCRWDLGVAAFFDKSWNEIHLAAICNDDERFWLCRDWSLWRNNKCVSTSTSSPEGFISSSEEVAAGYDVSRWIEVQKKLLQDMMSADVSSVNEFQIDLRVHSNNIYREAKKLARKYLPTCYL